MYTAVAGYCISPLHHAHFGSDMACVSVGRERTVGCLVTTNHNKAAVHGLVSQPITAYVGHLCWQLLVAITCGGQW